jgi:hypothetical protein
MFLQDENQTSPEALNDIYILVRSVPLLRIATGGWIAASQDTTVLSVFLHSCGFPRTPDRSKEIRTSSRTLVEPTWRYFLSALRLAAGAGPLNAAPQEFRLSIRSGTGP